MGYIIGEFVNSKELAKLLGISARRIQQLSADGVLPSTDKDHGRMYNLADTVQAYIKHVQTKTDKSASKSRIAKLQEEKLKAEIDLKQSQGELHQLKTQIAQGKYISVEEAQLEYQKFFVVFKKFATAIAPRVGGIIGAHVDPVIARGIEKSVAAEVNDMLRSFIFAAGGKTAEPAEKKKPSKASAARGTASKAKKSGRTVSSKSASAAKALDKK